MKNIKTVGIVGAGTMGSALAQKFTQEGFTVILADRNMDFVERGLQNIKNMFTEGVEKRIFTHEQIAEFLKNLTGTENLSDLQECDLIIEAIYENFSAKSELFKRLCARVPFDTILATNTSSFSITELSASVTYPERFIGLHYFFHAAKNRLVEIIPGERTSEDITKSIFRFCLQSGKDPIYSIDAHGFVVNRFFVPWLNEAVHLLEEGISIEQIEHVCKETFGISMGPFELMNVTGVPVAYHAEKTLEIFGNLYKVSEALKIQAEKNQLWDFNKSENTPKAIIPAVTEKKIKERMLGMIFFICSQILDEGICSPSEIDRGAKIGLKWKRGPVELMKRMGEEEVIRLIVKTKDLYDMALPAKIGEKFWQSTPVRVEKKGDIAIVTMDQPENLNALNEESMKHLGASFEMLEQDDKIKTIFLTGSGKAFVAGADIKFFVKNIKQDKIHDIESFTQFGQQVFERIDKSKKKVVAIVNGLALGGGLELALCADVILALPKAQLAFPETGIGIYPGLGGTQRATKKIGKGLSKFLILTGKMLSAKDALNTGLVDKIISLEEMFSLLEGEIPVPEFPKQDMTADWIPFRNFFENNTLEQVLENNFTNDGISPEEVKKLLKIINFKAPVAIKIAHQLIDEEKGCASELLYLREIFSTSDALLGLTSIGQKVDYLGK